MFDNSRRTIIALKTIVINELNFRSKMKRIKKNEDWALSMIDRTFADIRNTNLNNPI